MAGQVEETVLLRGVWGHDKLLGALKQAFRSRQLASTFLFVGPKGVGKKLTALGYAQLLLCSNVSDSGEACGRCSNCLRVVKGQHESLRLVVPDKNQIKIEQTRDILHFLSLRSLTPNRVVIIDSAERLNPQASNSLLKILEEPNPGVFFFLIATNADQLLATIRSRSQIFHFPPLSQEVLLRKHKGPEWILKAAQGSFEKLRSLADPGEMESRNEAIQLLRLWAQDPRAYLRPELRETFRDRSGALSTSKHLIYFLRDAVVWKLGRREELLNPDQGTLFEMLSGQTLEMLLETGRMAAQLEAALLANRDSQLAFEEFFIKSRGLVT